MYIYCYWMVMNWRNNVIGQSDIDSKHESNVICNEKESVSSNWRVKSVASNWRVRLLDSWVDEYRDWRLLLYFEYIVVSWRKITKNLSDVYILDKHIHIRIDSHILQDGQFPGHPTRKPLHIIRRHYTTGRTIPWETYEEPATAYSIQIYRTERRPNADLIDYELSLLWIVISTYIIVLFAFLRLHKLSYLYKHLCPLDFDTLEPTRIDGLRTRTWTITKRCKTYLTIFNQLTYLVVARLCIT